MARELPKTYDPKDVENRLYRFWSESGYFHTERDPEKKPFTIVMPPPNVTGQLHMGHAMDAAMQDVLIRFKRMQGYAALWVPGVDHAGIATQIRVEEELRKEGSPPTNFNSPSTIGDALYSLSEIWSHPASNRHCGLFDIVQPILAPAAKENPSKSLLGLTLLKLPYPAYK